jgi:hypothetical protein
MKKTSIVFILAVFIVILFILFYCLITFCPTLTADKKFINVTVHTDILQSITITPVNTVIPLNSSQQYLAIGHYKNGKTLNITRLAKWTSSNEKIASITSEGLSTSVRDGVTRITATYAGISNIATLSIDSVVIFTSSDTTFAPVLSVKPGATVKWRFADGTTSNSARPFKIYRDPAIRQNRLGVTPWSALTGVNLGYDGADGGSSSIERIPPQGVISVKNMELMAPYVRQWCSSYNQIPSLDFDNFINLDTLECYHATNLTSVSLHNTPSLRRVCFEACQITSLNVSESPNLKDFRSALNRNISITFGNNGKYIWHLCLRDNPQFLQILPIKQFTSLQELLIWNDNQSGSFTNASHNLTYVDISNNKYTCADFTRYPNLITCRCSYNHLTSLVLTQCSKLTTLKCAHNNLATLDISSCTALTHIDAHQNNLTQPAVDHILAVLVNGKRTNGNCNLALNSPPSSKGLNSRGILISRGWTVDVSSELSNSEWYLHDILYDYIKI